MKALVLLLLACRLAFGQGLPFPGPGNATGPPPPVFASGAFTATDGSGAAFNTSTIAVTVSGSNTLLVACWHAEFPTPIDQQFEFTFNGLWGAQFFETQGYTGGATNTLFRCAYWVAPAAGTHDLTVSMVTAPGVPMTIANELTVTAALYTGVAQVVYPFRDTAKDVSAVARTSESVTVTSALGDLVVHVIGHSLAVVGTLGAGETARITANDSTDDASVLVATKAGAATSTVVQSSGWAVTFPLEGLAFALMPAGTAENHVVLADTFGRANEAPLSQSGAWTQPVGTTVFAVNLVSNLAVGGTAAENIAVVATPTFGADQRARITYAGGASFTRVWVRLTNSGGYMLTSNSASGVQLFKVANSGVALTYTKLGADITLWRNLITGDLLELEVSGTTLNAYMNGQFLATRTDATYATGQPGLGSFGAVSIASDFQATSLPGRN